LDCRTAEWRVRKRRGRKGIEREEVVVARLENGEGTLPRATNRQRRNTEHK
jgi:hypothetical protein